MEPGSICVKNHREARAVPPYLGVVFWPRSFSASREIIKEMPLNSSLHLREEGRYRGFSPLFHCWTDTDEIKDQKLANLPELAAIHLSFAAGTDGQIPFRLFTEPFGREHCHWEDDVFGRWDWGPGFCRRVADVLLGLGITHISISQNRLRDPVVGTKTLDLCHQFEAEGIGCSYAFQVWMGFMSVESAEIAIKLIELCEQDGVAAYVGEFGFRYSLSVTPSRTGLDIAREEMLYCRKRLLKNAVDRLNEAGVDWTFWNGDRDSEPRAGGLIYLPEMDPLDATFRL